MAQFQLFSGVAFSFFREICKCTMASSPSGCRASAFPFKQPPRYHRNKPPPQNRPTPHTVLAHRWNYKMFWDGRDHVAIVHLWGVRPSEGLSCWIRTRDQSRCPPIDQGMIPSQKDYLQDVLWKSSQVPLLFFFAEMMFLFLRKGLFFSFCFWRTDVLSFFPERA